MAAGKKKPATPDDVMSAAEMRPILALAKRGDPASCAIALTTAKDGVILLDKRVKPKKLLAELKKKAAAAGLELEAPSLRFGRAIVDPEGNPGLLTFMVNKTASGTMRPKLLEQVKRAGYKAVEIITDERMELEPEDDGPQSSDATGAAPADLATSETPVSPPVASGPTPARDPGALEPGNGAKHDAAALTKELTDTVREMMSVVARNASAKAELVDLAKVAQASAKLGDAVQFRSAIMALRDALKRAAAEDNDANTTSGPDAALVQKLKKTRAVWDATVAKLTRDLEQLVKTVNNAAAGHELGTSFEKEFTTVVKPLITTVDTSLSDLLDRAAEAGSAQEHEKMMEQARLTVKQLTKFVQTHPVIDHLDENPFHPVAVSKILTASLAAASKSLS